MSLDRTRHDPKQKDATLLLMHGTAAYEHVPSPERRSSTDVLAAKCYHQPCYEREQQSARELQKLRDSFGALKLEKDKEIAFLRDQLAAYASLSKSPVRAPAPLLCVSVGVQTTVVAAAAVASSTLSPTREPPPRRAHALAPSVFSVTSKGVVRTVRLDRQASLKSARVLAAAPHDAVNGVASRVAAALTDPVLSLPYLHSIQFGADLIELSAQVCAVLETEPRCLSAQSPVHVFGDIHGNYTDLRFFADTLWPMGLALAPGSFLFLGDYVDRGAASLECVAYLFAHKLLQPRKLLLLRGNHETRAVNGLETHYGTACLLAQCKARFGADEGAVVWHQINHAFDRLPLAAVIDNDIFCVHGGVPRPPAASTSNTGTGERTVDAIQRIPSTALLDVLDARYYADNAHISMVSDMLWGDPASEALEPSLDSRGFGKSPRGGVAVSFGERAIEQFLVQHRFSRILRAHEAKIDGVAVSKSARIVTVFSTSKDHGLGDDATCGCLLIDDGRIVAINRAAQVVSKSLQLQRRRSLSYQSAPLLGAGVAPTAICSSVQGGHNAASACAATAGTTAAAALQTGAQRRFEIAAVIDLASSTSGANDGASRRRHRSLTASPSSSRNGNSSDGSESTDDEEEGNGATRARRSRTARAVSAGSEGAIPCSASVSSGLAPVAPVPFLAAAPVVPSSSRIVPTPVFAQDDDDEEEDDEDDNNQHDDA